MRRWAPLSEGSLDVVNDAQMSIFRRPVVRRDSLGKDILSSPNSRPAPLIVDNNESALEISASVNVGANEMGGNFEQRDIQSKSLPHGNPDKFGFGMVLPRIRINGRSPVPSAPKASTRGRRWKSKSLSPSRDEAIYDVENDYGTSSSPFVTSLLR